MVLTPARSRQTTPWLALGCITLAGLVVRLVAVGNATRTLNLNDGLLFHAQANFIAQGHGFVDAGTLIFGGLARPTAQHPPLFSLLLSSISWLGHESILAHQLTCVVMSAAAVPLIGLAANEVAGARAGLVAAAIAAVYPNFWSSDAYIMSESLYVTMVALTLWMLYRLWNKPTMSRAIWAGVAIGLATLTRAEALLFVPFALVPLLVMRREGAPLKPRVTYLGVAIAASVVVISPWVVRNLVTFERPVLLSDNTDSVVGGANCRETYYGPMTGSWAGCNGQARPSRDESFEFAKVRHRGIDFARSHGGRLPVVIAARVGRQWEVFRPLQGLSDLRSTWNRRVALLAFYAIQPLAIAGLLQLRRQSIPVIGFVAPAAFVTLTAIVGYGLWRLRLPWDVAAVILAGVALARFSERGRPGSMPLRETKTETELTTAPG
jgi:4-amino-4-deoxy-L-arabinose transferase-like glycosyltransferase